MQGKLEYYKDLVMLSFKKKVIVTIEIDSSFVKLSNADLWLEAVLVIYPTTSISLGRVLSLLCCFTLVRRFWNQILTYKELKK